MLERSTGGGSIGDSAILADPRERAISPSFGLLLLPIEVENGKFLALSRGVLMGVILTTGGPETNGFVISSC
jgi:hypothetical protein